MIAAGGAFQGCSEALGLAHRTRVPGVGGLIPFRPDIRFPRSRPYLQRGANSPMAALDQIYDEAIALQEGGRLDEAVKKLEQLVEQDPEYALAHSALSVFYGRLERLDEAVEHAQKVCALEPDDAFSYVALSLICQKAGRIEEAEVASMEARRRQSTAEYD